jgi:Flp pilus assembly protein TadD
MQRARAEKGGAEEEGRRRADEDTHDLPTGARPTRKGLDETRDLDTGSRQVRRRDLAAGDTETEAEPRKPSETASHDWDAIVQKARKTAESERGEGMDVFERRRMESAGKVSRKAGFIAEVQALAKFDEGLACMKKRDYHGALEAWTAALKLDPENKLYQGNLKMLRKLMNEGEHES